MTSNSDGWRFAWVAVDKAEYEALTRHLPATARAFISSGASFQECSLPDLVELLTCGLLRARPSQATPNQAVLVERAVHLLFALSSDRLYGFITKEAKRLGVIHGLRIILALERCQTHLERKGVAIQFVDAVWHRQGVDRIQELCEALNYEVFHH